MANAQGRTRCKRHWNLLLQSLLSCKLIRHGDLKIKLCWSHDQTEEQYFLCYQHNTSIYKFRNHSSSYLNTVTVYFIINPLATHSPLANTTGCFLVPFITNKKYFQSKINLQCPTFFTS